MLLLCLNLIITIAWVGLSQDFSPTNLIVGFSLGYGALFVIAFRVEDRRYFTKIPQILSFVVFYVWELFRSNIEVAWDVLTPRDHSSPGIVRIPITLESEFQIALLMNLLTFTPGSLSVDLSEDHKHLYVHGMFIRDPEDFVNTIVNDFEKRIKKLFE